MFTVNFTKIYNRLLSFTIAIQIIINSTNAFWKDSFFKETQYCLWVLMVIILLYFIQSRGITKRAVIGLCISFLYVIALITLFKDKTFVPLLIFGAYCIYMNDIQIVRNYMNGIILAIIVIIGLSVIGYIPMKTDTNLLSMGFGNPNTLGFLLTIAYFGYCIVYKGSTTKRLLFAITLILFDIFYLDDNTASIIVGLFFVLQQVKSYQVTYLIREITACMPEILLLFCYFITYTYGNYDWSYTLNSFLTGRPEIWAFYNNSYGIHLLPQHVQAYSLTSFEYFTFGKNVPLQYRGFDGAYVYLLISEGIIVTFVIIISLTYLIRQLDLKQEKIILFSILCILIFGITESIAIAPLGYFENYLLTLTIKKILLGKTESKLTSK